MILKAQLLQMDQTINKTALQQTKFNHEYYQTHICMQSKNNIN